uniref:Uncharacterized protein n=1 Tax=Timema tahoe TaxID=61484 RepID=A0A7R9IGJ0_9NEOP|nr:unnamed protein product [Timema tahoe]
MLECSTLCLHF